jgi:hypothetical protein
VVAARDDDIDKRPWGTYFPLDAGAVPGAMRFTSLISLHGNGVDDVEGMSHVVRHSHRTTAAVRGAEPPRS